MMDKAFYRSLWGFLAFLPFCWLWGVEGFTWFSLIGTLYFIPVHWLFDRVSGYPKIKCILGIHKWVWIDSEGYPGLRKCVACGEKQEGTYDFFNLEWRKV